MITHIYSRGVHTQIRANPTFSVASASSFFTSHLWPLLSPSRVPKKPILLSHRFPSPLLGLTGPIPVQFFTDRPPPAPTASQSWIPNSKPLASLISQSPYLDYYTSNLCLVAQKMKRNRIRWKYKILLQLLFSLCFPLPIGCEFDNRFRSLMVLCFGDL